MKNLGCKSSKTLMRGKILLIDSCAIIHLMSEAQSSLRDALESHLISLNQSMTVLDVVQKELTVISQRNDIELATLAKAAIFWLRGLAKEGLVFYMQTSASETSCADQYILQVALQLKEHHKTLVLTDDQALSADLLSFNSFQSISGHPVEVGRIGDACILSPKLPNAPIVPLYA